MKEMKEMKEMKKLVRQCISCRKQLTRDNFIRITKNKDHNQETVVINPDKHQFGRSVYICKTKECITKAIKEKKIVKILKSSTKNLESIIPDLEKLIIRHSATCIPQLVKEEVLI